MSKKLLAKQEKINNEIRDNGKVSEDIIMEQVKINACRNYLNIVDEDEIIYTNNNGEVFVQ